jgi:hypothetical protein
MKARTSIAVIGSTALLGTGAFLLPAVASTHTPATHTLKFTAVTTKQAGFTKNTGGQAEKDVNKKGKIVGFDEIYYSYDTTTKTATGGVTLVTKGGFLYGTLIFGSGSTTKGTVTGGTGKFAGVTGTILGKDLNKAGTKTAVTIKYH